jgi:glutamate-ammonia-ligase adenylyltransferase
LPGGDASVLLQAHATLLARGLDCTLDRRPRIVIEDAAIADAREQVRRACRAAGLDFTAA